jgi:hypothetical protein
VELNGVVYLMHNPKTNVTIECTKAFIPKWVVRGFDICGVKGTAIDEAINKMFNK